MNKFPEIKEIHCIGITTIENVEYIKEMISKDFESIINVDVGLQISKSGNLWVCINGVALLRFKPKMGVIYENEKETE